MMEHKSILKLWQILLPGKHLPDDSNLGITSATVIEQKELHRRLRYGFLGVTVPLSLGFHGLALPIAALFSNNYFRSPTVQHSQEELLIDVSVTEFPEAIQPPQDSVASLPSNDHSQVKDPVQDDDTIAALPASSVPFAPLSQNESQKSEPKNTTAQEPPQVATAGNLAPENTPDQEVPKSAPTPVAPSPVASFSPMIERILTSSSFSNNSVPAPPNVGGGKGVTASLNPAGVGQIGRGLGWGNLGSRHGNPPGNHLNGNQIGLFSGRLGVPWGKPSGNGNNGISANNGNQGSNQGNGRGRIRCQECSKPQYPDSARERRLEGAATVAVDIAPDGSVTNVRIMQSSGHPELDEAAINAARGWRFEASATGRQAVPGRMNFQIEGSEYAQQSQRARETASATPPVRDSDNASASPVASQTKPVTPKPMNPEPLTNEKLPNMTTPQPSATGSNSVNNSPNNHSNTNSNHNSSNTTSNSVPNKPTPHNPSTSSPETPQLNPPVTNAAPASIAPIGEPVPAAVPPVAEPVSEPVPASPIANPVPDSPNSTK
ncbi:MAG: TonB family protein [Pseudanabaenaceae cyanobacterium]